MDEEALIASIGDVHLCLDRADGEHLFTIDLQGDPWALDIMKDIIIVGIRRATGHEMRIFDTTGALIHRFDLEAVPSRVKFNATGEKFALCLINGLLVMYEGGDCNWTVCCRWQAHTGWIACICWIRDDFICTGGQDHSLKVWDSTSGNLVRLLTADNPSIFHAIGVLQEGNGFLTGEDYGCIRKWRIDEGQIGEPVIAHGGSIVGLIFAEEFDIVVTCSRDQSIKAWKSTEFAAPIWEYIAVSSGGRIVLNGDEIIVGINNSAVIALNILTGQLVRTYSASQHTGNVVVALQRRIDGRCRFKFVD